MSKYISKLLYILADVKGSLVLLFLACITASLLEAISIGLIGPFWSLASKPELIQNNFFLNWVYQLSRVKSYEDFILLVGVTIAVFFCIKSTVYFFAKTYIYKFAYRQKGRLCLQLMQSYLMVPYTFYLQRNTSTLVKNIVIETDRFCYGFMLPLLEGTANSIVVISLVILLLKTDFLFFAIISGVILPVFLLVYTLRKRFKQWGKDASESRHEMIRIINHALGGLKETRIIGCEDFFEIQIYEQGNRYATAESKFVCSQIFPRVAIETILVLFLLLFVSVYQFISSQGVETIVPTMSVFAVASIRLIPSVSQVINAIGNVQNASYAVDIIYMDLKDTENQRPNKYIDYSNALEEKEKFSSRFTDEPNLNFTSKVEIHNLTYNYPDAENPALSNISLTLNKGESIAFIGKSGAGKTTLVDVILGFLQPEIGNILVDDNSIYKNLRAWQNLIGYIPQSIFLIDDTIEKNIAFGVPDNLIDLEKLNKAIQTAQLTELIAQLPEGVKTVVGERGIRLSGGQRQRIGIARALYHEREILVLDEATSALDNETEALVTEAIKSLSGKKTMIIIAHRLTTVKHCNRIYLLEKGRIVKSGSYAEVVSRQEISSQS